MKIVLATHNKGKIQEVQTILSHPNIEVLPIHAILPEFQLPEETGTTYEENALIKAKAVGDAVQELVLSDDSGLEVGAVPDLLGVHSARFFHGTDQERNHKLLDMVKLEQDRSAKYVCVIVLYDPQTKTYQHFHGEFHGSIAFEPKGNDGFGFDPVFIPLGYTQTVAELGSELKNTISHRAKALDLCRQFVFSRYNLNTH